MTRHAARMLMIFYYFDKDKPISELFSAQNFDPNQASIDAKRFTSEKYLVIFLKISQIKVSIIVIETLTLKM